MNFTYINGGVTHTDTTLEYMQSIGMNSDQIKSVLSQKDYEDGLWNEHRAAAYRAESDPLFIEWQYDQQPEQETAWREKVAEIKARYPKPAA